MHDVPSPVSTQDIDEAFREHEDRHRLLFQAAPAPMWVFDVETLAILRVNDAALEQYGYTRDEFLALTLRDLLPPSGRAALWRAQISMRAGHEVHSVQRHWARDRTPFDVEILTRTLPVGGGRLRLALALDVTQRQEREDNARFLDRASRALTASLDQRTICRTLATLAVPRLGDWCVVHRLTADGQLAIYGFAHANPLEEGAFATMLATRRIDGAAHPAWQAVHAGQPSLLPQAGHDDGALSRTMFGATAASGPTTSPWHRIHSALHVPLMVRGQAIGVLECAAGAGAPALTARDLGLAQELALRATIAIDNALRYDEARQQSIHAAMPPAVRDDPSGAASPPGDFPGMSILETITDGFFALDREWKILYANSEAERVLQHPREELTGQNFWQLFPEAVGTIFDEQYHLVLAERRSVTFEGHYPTLNQWYSVRAVPSADGLAIFFRDVTDRRRIEEQRRQAEQALRDFAESASDLIHMLAPDGRVLYANPAWRHALGYTEEEAEGLSVFDVVVPEHHEVVRAALVRCLSGEPLREFEADVLSKDGRRLTVSGNASCRFTDGQPVATYGIYRDVTCARAQEAALRRTEHAATAASRAKSEFLDRMSHELRTPLASILGFSRLLEANRQGRLSDTELQYARRISAQGTRLLGMVEDVLAYTEIEARRAELVVAPVSLGVLLREVLREFEPRASERGLRLVAELPDADTPLRTDAAKLRQMLRYLLDNSIRFTTHGSVTLALRCDPATQRPESIEVRDTGVGINSDRLDAVLERFEQEETGLSRPHDGAGLGLTIARSLCEVLGYTLVVESVQHAGTTVRVSLTDPVPTASGSIQRAQPPRGPETEVASLFHAVVNASPLAIVVYSTDLTVRLWNDAAERMFGWSAGEVLGQPIPFFPEEDETESRSLLRRVLEVGSVTDVPVRRRRKDGRIIDANSSIAALRDPRTRLLGFVSLLHDVTDRRQLEAQLQQTQKMEVVGLLAGGIAHDFNNVLSVIGASASFIIEGLDADDELRADAEEIQAATSRAAVLTRQLLMFARKQPSKRQAMDLRLVVGGFEAMLRRVVGSHIELAVLSAPWPCEIFADPLRIEQAVLNLVLNARDAMPKGGAIIIEVHPVSVAGKPAPAEQDVPPGDYAMLLVSDTGCGMDETTRRRIFEPFFTTKPAGQGTGLGLASVHRLVEEAGGHIRVETSPGAGTVFRLYFPVSRVESPMAGARVATQSTSGSETVLLVEDEEAVRAVAARILRAKGYTVLLARHGADAMDIAMRHRGTIHVLLTDVVMPEMDGYSLAAQLAEHIPALRVVYMSGYTDEARRQAAHSAASACDANVIQKPFTSDGLASAVRRALDGPSARA